MVEGLRDALRRDLMRYLLSGSRRLSRAPALELVEWRNRAVGRPGQSGPLTRLRAFRFECVFCGFIETVDGDAECR